MKYDVNGSLILGVYHGSICPKVKLANEFVFWESVLEPVSWFRGGFRLRSYNPAVFLLASFTIFKVRLWPTSAGLDY